MVAFLNADVGLGDDDDDWTDDGSDSKEDAVSSSDDDGNGKDGDVDNVRLFRSSLPWLLTR